jgi:cysteine-rich repeat protein
MAVLAAAIVSWLAASPLSANFHFMNIVQVFGGSAAAPDAQYVMLQMWTGGQNVVGGHELTIYNGDGSVAVTLPFPPSPGGDVDNGANQATILIGTAEAQALFGVTMDLVISPVDTTGEGVKIRWAGASDCVAIGGYTGSTTGVGLPFLMGDFAGLALTRRLDVCTGLGATAGLDLCDDTDNSATDFVLTLPSPRNNVGQLGTLPASTCGNNTLEGLEDCDDGDTESGDGCSNVCKYEPEQASPQTLAVDTAANQSDGNGVLEAGEAVSVVPSWKNTDAGALDLVGGATAFTGPAGATYTPRIGLARYGVIDPGDVHSCAATAFCYQLALSAPAARPAMHWDTSFDEVLGGGGRKTWTLHVGDSFTDVPRDYLFYRRIETVLHHGITAGCSATQYCPGDRVRRDQMGLFLGRAIAGGGANIPVSGTVGASPYNCIAGGVSLFSDIAPGDSTCKAIHYIAAQNVAGGCGAGAFCPASNVTRAEMGLFVARGLVAPLGGGAVPMTYGPDPVTGRSYSCNPASPVLNFTDITTADAFCKHVHYLWAKGIVSGCSTTTPEYCPGGEVSRGEMARFLSNAFAPNLYEP